MTNIVFQNISLFNQSPSKTKNANISLILARIKKIRPLYFLQLLKFDMIKWSFITFWAKIREIRSFSCFLLIFLYKPLLQKGGSRSRGRGQLSDFFLYLCVSMVHWNKKTCWSFWISKKSFLGWSIEQFEPLEILNKKIMFYEIKFLDTI